MITQKITTANGLLKTAGDSRGIISNEYNGLNRLTKSCGLGPNSVVSYGYYPAGQVSVVTSVAGVVSYSLDAGDRLSSIFSPFGTFNFSYNTNNGLVADVASTSGASAAFGYDALDRVTDISWKDSSNNVVRGFAYGYNAVGMITQKVTTANGLLSTNLYEYDSLDRLTSETSVASVTSVVNYFYDLVGNRTQMVQNGQTINYTLSANHLLSWSTNSQQKFDSAGNVTNIQHDDGRQLSMTWDSRYRLTSVATNGTTAETYGYDALGRRITISDGSTTNYLIYDGIHCIAEVGMSGSLVRSYTYGPGLDNIFSMTVYGASTQTYYYVKDHLGSVLALTDSSGTIVEFYQYDAWGNVLGVYDSTGGVIQASSIGNRYLWQGREYSWKSGLYYFRARWYEPVTGRWLSNDPIGISGGLNQYVFCANNPMNFRDPLGLCRDTCRGRRGNGWGSMSMSGGDDGTDYNPWTDPDVWTSIGQSIGGQFSRDPNRSGFAQIQQSGGEGTAWEYSYWGAMGISGVGAGSALGVGFTGGAIGSTTAEGALLATTRTAFFFEVIMAGNGARIAAIVAAMGQTPAGRQALQEIHIISSRLLPFVTSSQAANALKTIQDITGRFCR